MTTPDVPLRMELEFELPGSPEQVWDAIATANGISAWMMPTELEEREGGAVCFHMGDDIESNGTITAWEPPRRLAYEEPEWAALAGRADSEVTPLVSEFVVEALSGGTCVLRVVTSGFGTGAEWEQEFMTEMEKGWAPCFDILSRYLTYFPGQRVTNMSVDGPVHGAPAAVLAAMRSRLGLVDAAPGDAVDVEGNKAEVERLGDDGLQLRLTAPVPGFLSIFTFGTDDEGNATARIEAALFSDDAAAYVERERPKWAAWVEQLSTG